MVILILWHLPLPWLVATSMQLHFKSGLDRFVKGDNITLTNASLSVNKREFAFSNEPAGDISLHAKDSIRLNSGSSLESKSPASSGGNIMLFADNLIYLRDSQISTSVTSPTGNGGNVTIDTQPSSYKTVKSLLMRSKGVAAPSALRAAWSSSTQPAASMRRPVPPESTGKSISRPRSSN